MKIVIANWKTNPETVQEARAIASRVERGLPRNHAEAVICPPAVFLSGVKPLLHRAKLGAQNVSAETGGPFTGEISAEQLQRLGVKYVIVGHSERRAMGESDKLINEKIKRLTESKIEPILCVGFGTTRNMSEDAIKKTVRNQLKAAFKGINIKKFRPSVAYEPVWTISKGYGKAKPVSPKHASEIIKYLKSQAPHARIIYGASITAKNAPELAAYPSIEGGLVGGASLNSQEFLKIIKAFSSPAKIF